MRSCLVTDKARCPHHVFLPGIPYIIGNEAAERFSFYGMRAVLVVFMTQYLLGPGGASEPMDEAEAKGWYHLFVSAVYFTPSARSAAFRCPAGQVSHHYFPFTGVLCRASCAGIRS